MGLFIIIGERVSVHFYRRGSECILFIEEKGSAVFIIS